MLLETIQLLLQSIRSSLSCFASPRETSLVYSYWLDEKYQIILASELYVYGVIKLKILSHSVWNEILSRPKTSLLIRLT